jgi:flagellar biosynthetic protein FlhB
MNDKDNKTEEATPKRLRDAKKKGQVAKSGDLSAAASLLIFIMSIGVLGNYLFSNSLKFLKTSLQTDYTILITKSNLGSLFIKNIINFGVLILPFVLIAMVIGISISLVQTGFIFSTEPLKPDLKRLNPIEGFKGIFSKKSIFNLVKNILKLFLVFYMTYKNLTKNINQIINSGNLGTEKIFFFLLDFIKDLTFNIILVMFALSIVDYVFQKRDFKKNLRMTKQEVMDEFKEMEGNPEIKSFRASKQRQISMSRMMSSIKESTVVVTNPTHIAVVLRYDSKLDKAPIVTAKGEDYLAEKIKEVARINKIPIMENRELARAMYRKVEIGDQVPVDLYKAVAEILAVVYQMQEKNKGKI